MDPVTLIVTALAAGAALGLKDTASSAMKDAYLALRALAGKRLAGRPNGELVMAQHEQAPQTWQAPLVAELAAAGAADDADLLAAAHTLTKLAEEAGFRSVKYTVDVRGSQGVAVGDHNAQTNVFPPPVPMDGLGGDHEDDRVVLLDEIGNPCGTAPRVSVHQRQTPLHLAFSCYITRPSGEVLVTRRALTKATWPGVWTNSCCGHPRPGEGVETAVARRVREELGVGLAAIKPLIPDYRYMAVDASGIMEREVCPVYLGIAAGDDVRPDPGEVAEFRWSSWEALGLVAARTPWLLSPWASEQIALLRKPKAVGT